MNSGILQKPVLYLSYYLKQHRSECYDLLQEIWAKGNWERWLAFFLQGVLEVSDQATETARSIIALRESDRTKIAKALGQSAGSGRLVLEDLYRHPIVPVNELAELLKYTYPAANQLVTRFEKLLILVERTGQARNRRFRSEPYAKIFEFPRP